MTFWADLSSSVQFLNIIGGPAVTVSSQLWVQFEIMLSDEFFFDPNNTYSSKLLRIERQKTADDCLDKRLADVRFARISTSEVKIGLYPSYCGKGAGGDTQISITRAEAGTWFRVTALLDLGEGSAAVWAKNLSSGETKTSPSASVSGAFAWAKNNSMTRAYFVLHSTAHKPSTSFPSPNFWVRHALLAHAPISH